jgi:acetyl-CoA C-acetyltransferase
MSSAYIVQGVRTAGGRRNGKLAQWHPADLTAEVLNALVARSHIDPAVIEDVIVGCVSQVGEQSLQVGRNAVLASMLPDTVPAVTIDRQCGSSQQAVQFAAQAVMSGTQDIVVAAGVECMSRIPFGTAASLALKAGMGGPLSERIKRRYGVGEFNEFTAAHRLATNYGIARDELDVYALESHRRAAEATRNGAFEAEILPLQGDHGAHTVDEGIRFDTSLERISSLKPFQQDGFITAGNSSQICDGAAGVLIVSERALHVHGLEPLARIHAMTVVAGDPVLMLEGPIPGTQRVLQRSGLRIDDIDCFEVNEAFASVPLAWLKALGADPRRLNVNGGAIALGHPLGATGAKLMVTLVNILRSRNGRYGLQAVCEGGGLANVTIVEAL